MIYLNININITTSDICMMMITLNSRARKGGEVKEEYERIGGE